MPVESDEIRVEHRDPHDATDVRWWWPEGFDYAVSTPESRGSPGRHSSRVIALFVKDEDALAFKEMLLAQRRAA